MEALTGLSAGIEMRKKNQSSFCNRSAQGQFVFSKMVPYLMPAVLEKGGLMKIDLTIFLVMIILLSSNLSPRAISSPLKIFKSPNLRISDNKSFLVTYR